jgi:hypothetical protein
MSLKKRLIGRRVAGVGVAVTLMVLGLQAPASAAVTITALSPTSGPTNCVVVATGSGFKDFPAAQNIVDFVLNPGIGETVVNAPDIAVISDTILWVVNPGLSDGSSYSLRVTNPGNTPNGITSTVKFLDTASAGGCAPTITAFTPTCGSAGDTVVITGTNLIDADLDDAEVLFSPYNTTDNDGTPTVPDVADVTSLSTVVPSGTSGGGTHPTTDGPIKVTTDVGSVFSATSFLVPPPDCTAATGHTRAITFKLKKSGKASGVVSSTETTPFTACVNAVPVKIQKKKKGGGWKTAASATTSDTGSYSAKTKGKPGKYRALAPATTVGTPATDCLKAKSATRTIK